MRVLVYETVGTGLLTFAFPPREAFLQRYYPAGQRFTLLNIPSARLLEREADTSTTDLGNRSSVLTYLFSFRAARQQK